MRLSLFILAIAPVWGGVLPRADLPEAPVVFSVADEFKAVPDRYLVSLEAGYTLAEHWEAIGRDLSREGEDFRYLESINVYVATIHDADIVHEGIRTDTKVKLVESMCPAP
jgi:hypothetical protein